MYDAYALEDYCKKNIDKDKRINEISFLNMFNIFKKSKAVAIIIHSTLTQLLRLQFSDVSQPNQVHQVIQCKLRC